MGIDIPSEQPKQQQTDQAQQLQHDIAQSKIVTDSAVDSKSFQASNPSLGGSHSDSGSQSGIKTEGPTGIKTDKNPQSSDHKPDSTPLPTDTNVDNKIKTIPDTKPEVKATFKTDVSEKNKVNHQSDFKRPITDSAVDSKPLDKKGSASDKGKEAKDQHDIAQPEIVTDSAVDSKPFQALNPVSDGSHSDSGSQAGIKTESGAGIKTDKNPQSPDHKPDSTPNPTDTNVDNKTKVIPETNPEIKAIFKTDGSEKNKVNNQGDFKTPITDTTVDNKPYDKKGITSDKGKKAEDQYDITQPQHVSDTDVDSKLIHASNPVPDSSHSDSGSLPGIKTESAEKPKIQKAKDADSPPPPKFEALNEIEKESLFGEIKFKKVPKDSDKEHIQITNKFEENNIVKVDIPQLKGIEKGSLRKKGENPIYFEADDTTVRFHKKGAQQLKDLFAAWEKAGLMSQIKTWDGSFDPRVIRGTKKDALSNHAYGTGFDINYEWNTLGKEPAKSGKKGSVRELVQIANEHGFYWGGHFKSRKDGAHFELAEIKNNDQVKNSSK